MNAFDEYKWLTNEYIHTKLIGCLHTITKHTQNNKNSSFQEISYVKCQYIFIFDFFFYSIEIHKHYSYLSLYITEITFLDNFVPFPTTCTKGGNFTHVWILLFWGATKSAELDDFIGFPNHELSSMFINIFLIAALRFLHCAMCHYHLQQMSICHYLYIPILVMDTLDEHFCDKVDIIINISIFCDTTFSASWGWSYDVLRTSVSLKWPVWNSVPNGGHADDKYYRVDATILSILSTD